VTQKKKIQILLMPIQEIGVNEMSLKVAPYWGKLVDMNGDFIRNATQREWQESYSLNLRLGTMGYIVIDTISDMGVPHKICACVVGGYDTETTEQPTGKG
jgi:hypothetical protein